MNDDSVLAWSSAANLLLYDEDPGPRETNVGSRAELRVVDRREALVQLYARQVLVSLHADAPRILALAELAAAARTLRGAWRLVRARRDGASPDPRAADHGQLGRTATAVRVDDGEAEVAQPGTEDRDVARSAGSLAPDFSPTSSTNDHAKINCHDRLQSSRTVILDLLC